MQSPTKQQFDQSHKPIVVVDESTFTYLPKVSKAIGLSTLTMDQVSSKKLKNYQHFGLFLHGLEPVAFNRKVDPLPRCCFNCWSHEHRLLDCPKRLIGIFCCNCGRRYVRIDECPRCSRVFWELDASAREWLISYIPKEGQEHATDYSEKHWSKYMDDKDKRTSWESDSSKQKKREGVSKGVELSKYEGASTLVSRTTDTNTGDNDEWWAGGKSKDNVEGNFTQKQRTGVGSFKSLPISEKHSSSEGNLQKFHLKTDELIRRESEFLSRTTVAGKSDTDNWWAGGSNKEETVEERLNPMSEKEEDNHENTQVNEEDRKDGENVRITLAKTESDCENQFNSLDESSSATPSEEDEEDYDNIIVDEDEQLEESSVVGSTVRDFLDLLKAAKFLPLQQQNRIVLRFASECKKKF